MQERLATLTRAVIEEAAERGNAVIVGRGGAFILRKAPGRRSTSSCMRSLDARVRYLLARVEEIPGRRAAGRGVAARPVPADGRARGEYIRRLFGVDWLDARNYDLAIDTGAYGSDAVGPDRARP